MPPDESPQPPDEYVEATNEEMLADFKRALHTDLKAGKLGATALVQGLKVIRDMMPPPPPPKPVEDERVNLLEKMDSLPKARARNLIRQAIARIKFDLAQHEQALAKLEGVKRGDTDPV